MTLYLKYRPIDFTSLVGQEFIKTTLQAAIVQNKTVGAYLFTWPRGTGKTSTARIFAKAINCENNTDGNPCGDCDVCQSFSQNSLIDIIEIDAASHTGVDNIREIIEKAQFQPSQTKYKIYIIDEVHMLSKGAFNALLKILEEPPKHVKFILATTEIHKVPDTILSRCQRYDFRSITLENTRARLEYIAQEEWVAVDAESYDYIVKQAEGWLRNAISLFEQLILDSKISFQNISQTLGIISEEAKEVFLWKLQNKDASIFVDFEELQNSGSNFKIFFKEISHMLQTEAVTKLQSWWDISTDIELIEHLQDILWKLKNSFDEVLTVKTGLLKICSWYSGRNIQEEAQTVTPAKSAINKQEGIQKPQESTQKPQENILEQAQNIFWEETPKIEQIPENTWFDVDWFIKEVKKQGAKSALTMTMRGARVTLSDGVLTIQTKTAIMAKSASSNENKEYIQRAAEALGIEMQKIEIL